MLIPRKKKAQYWQRASACCCFQGPHAGSQRARASKTAKKSFKWPGLSKQVIVIFLEIKPISKRVRAFNVHELVSEARLFFSINRKRNFFLPLRSLSGFLARSWWFAQCPFYSSTKDDSLPFPQIFEISWIKPHVRVNSALESNQKVIFARKSDIFGVIRFLKCWRLLWQKMSKTSF